MDKGLTIVNAYTQYMPGYNDLKQNYQAINDSMRLIATDFKGKKIGLPLIGAGLAGGDWNIIRDIIKNNLEDMVDYTIVEWQR
jgi:O-acetyl-ADP-ribose deacetylase (regulator of RNase III)